MSVFDVEGLGFAEPRAIRIGITATVVGVCALAMISDPGRPADAALVALAGAVFVGWVWWPPRWPPLLTPVLAVGVLAPVVLAVGSGQVEQALFLASVLVVVVGWVEGSTWRAVVVGVLATAAPLVAAALVPAHESFGYWSWVLGIVFPWLLGRLVRQQLVLVARLEAARRELADQVITEERRRIARDVHDLVGHGLAAVLLQITSARHVLRRDPDAADEALAAAETAGRRSMAELRSTMALLRSESDGDTPAPGLAGVHDLVRAARADGLDVTYRTAGDLSGVDDGVALAAHRIVQESLANAGRHAPQARTEVTVTVDDAAVTLDVASVGAVLALGDDGRPRYGLVGMRERAEVVGGALSAGPTADGWRVVSTLPLRVTP